MTLRQRQSKFVHMTALLILHAEQLGYELTYGDTQSKPGNSPRHKPGSFHFKRLAVDFNLFRNGRYLRSTKSHLSLGKYWESIGGSWGGRFTKQDGNHYSYGEE